MWLDMRMDLLTFIDDSWRRRALAAATSSSPDYLWQIATGRRRSSTALAQAIERESALIGPEAVPKESLRPDVWPPIEAPQPKTEAA